MRRRSLMRLPVAVLRGLLLALPSILCGAQPERVTAPNPGGEVVNQLSLSGNACGPAALLSAFALASPQWQTLSQEIPGENDRGRLGFVIRRYGQRPSRHLDGRPRWNRQLGISLVDLADMANEMRGPRRLPELEWEVLLPGRRESPARLFRRTHSRISKSLRRGLPPVIGVQRLAQRRVAGEPSWVTVYGHFLVVTSLPRKLDRRATEIPFAYADPWGGVVRQGRLRLETRHGFSAVVAEIPDSRVGSQFLRKGEHSLVIVSSSLGDF